jgi:hypothetical protein
LVAVTTLRLGARRGRHVLAAVHPAIAVPVGAAIAMPLVLAWRMLAVLTVTLMPVMALMLPLRGRRGLRGGGDCDRGSDRGNDDFHEKSP